MRRRIQNPALNEQDSLFDLIRQAQEMYLERSQAERDLIYHVAKLDNESRSALILAYDFLRNPTQNN